jgi:immune inhibitor A
MKPSRIIAMTLVILLAVSAFSAVFVNRAESSVSYPEPKGIDENIKMASLTDEQVEPLAATHHSYWNLGDTAIWTYYWSGVGVGLSYYTLSYIGTDVEIWVQNSIKFPAGDPRNGPDSSPVPSALRPTKPTYPMLQYLGNQFENNILPKESEFFGAPLLHDGSNAQLQYMSGSIPDDPEYYYEPTGRSVILVCNIRDDNYFDPTYPYYVIGVHIGAYEDLYYDRNVVTLDAVSWFHGLGPASMNWGDHYYYPTDSLHNHNVLSPYAYDSTLAHEYQHLLHHEYIPGGELWMNEGCSMFSEFLCGYGIDPDYANSYFGTPDNSLVEWGDQGDINILADYGAVALWCMYLADRYGPDILHIYFLLGYYYGITGIDGVNYSLQLNHYNERFPEVYCDWTLANLIRADSPGAGKYNYKSLNLNDPIYIPIRLYDISGFPVPTTKGTDFGNTITILGYDTGVSKMVRWGADYIKFSDWSRPGFVYFDGDDIAVPPGWQLTTDGWWSGYGVDLANLLLEGNAYVDPANPTLTIVTAYDLEELWDFGFVQVSTDGGMTWTSLANAYTTSDHDPSAHPDIIANLPGLTGDNPDWSDWTTMDFDLTAYAGQTVMIGFRYMTDWATTWYGWWINSAAVSGADLTLTAVTPTYEADFKVTAVKAVWADGKYVYIPYDIKLDDVTEIGEHNTFAKNPTLVFLIVTPTMGAGTVDYQFKVYNK